MKKIITYGCAVAAAACGLVLLSLNTGQVRADNLRDYNPLFSYTAGTNYYYSVSGGLDGTGYTNAAVAKVFPVFEGSTLSFYVHAAAHSGNCSNNLTLVVYPAFGGTAAERQTLASSRIAFLCTNAADGTFATTFVTNITGFYAPYAHVQLEDPVQNVTRITNLVIRVNVKTP